MMNRLITMLFQIFILFCGNMVFAQITKNASAYGLKTDNSRSANTKALQDAFDAHLAGNLDILEVNAGEYLINNAIDIKGWNGLHIIGKTDENNTPTTVLSTNTDNPIFMAEFTLNQIHSLKNGLIRNLSLKSTFSGIATHINNPGLIFIGNVTIENLTFDNVAFSAPYADLNGFYVSNSSDPHKTSNLTFKNCHFHHLGKMGVEITNHPNEGGDLEISRYNDIYFYNNSFEHLGLITTVINGISETHGMGISLSGRGHHGLIQNNTFGENIANMNIENTGMNNLTIKNNTHLGSKGSMYQFSNAKWVVNNISISEEIASGNYTVTPNIFNDINNIEIFNTQIKGDFSIENTENLKVTNATIASNYTKDKGFGTLRMSGRVKNVLFDNCAISELENLSDSYPVIYTYNLNAVNVQVKNSCLSGDYKIEEESDPQVILENNASECDGFSRSHTEKSSCDDMLHNKGGSSIKVPQGNSLYWPGAKTIEGVSSDDDCALKLQKDATDNPWARYSIQIELDGNSSDLRPGDVFDFSIEANSVTGNARAIVLFNESSSGVLADSRQEFIKGQGWMNYSKSNIEIPQNATFLRIYLYPNAGHANSGYSLYKNLSLNKVASEAPTCDDSLHNAGDSTITLPEGISLYWPGAKTIEGVLSDADCALKLQKDVTDNPWARYSIQINLDSNSSDLRPGDVFDFSIDANSVTGNARAIVLFDENITGHLADSKHEFVKGQGWTNYSKSNIEIPQDATFLRIYLYPNAGHANSGYSLYKNLSIIKTQNSTALRASLNFASEDKNNKSKTISAFPNPTNNTTTLSLTSKESYTSFSVYNMYGEKLKAGKIGASQRKLPISFVDMQKGIYVLQLSNAKGEKAFKKIIKE